MAELERDSMSFCMHIACAEISGKIADFSTSPLAQPLDSRVIFLNSSAFSYFNP
jgi:hypothetical protein